MDKQLWWVYAMDVYCELIDAAYQRGLTGRMKNFDFMAEQCFAEEVDWA